MSMEFIQRSEHPERIVRILQRNEYIKNKRKAKSEWSYTSLFLKTETHGDGIKMATTDLREPWNRGSLPGAGVLGSHRSLCGNFITQVWAFTASSQIQEQPCFLSSQQSPCPNPSLWVPRLIFLKLPLITLPLWSKAFGHSSHFLMIGTKAFRVNLDFKLGISQYSTLNSPSFC